eukprot:TRINITY_DN7901_c0_g1_i5.p1 TRINITY_DN7901_c0_g1~~TRINITY_DN7901_c0_g1_i5.p1  ORF type:complete len:341 (+),score=68.94 TRINITY_DN7901_c0_g1_i5:619-1641(+)
MLGRQLCTEECESTDEKDDLLSSNIKVASYNAFLRPAFVSDGTLTKGFFDNDHKSTRARLIGKLLCEYDVVGLQEVFSSIIDYSQIVTSAAKSHGLIYSHKSSVHRSLGRTTNAFASMCKMIPFAIGLSSDGGSQANPIVDGGLLILSRYPISKKSQLIFEAGAGADSLSAKGIIYCLVHHPSTPIHVFCTHLQAGFNRNKCNRIHERQLKDIHEFITQQTSTTENLPTFLLGDFNLDYNRADCKDLMDNLMAMLHLRDTINPSNTTPRIATSLNHSASSIDYILYRDLSNQSNLARSFLETLPSPPTVSIRQESLSDHAVVVAEIKLPHVAAPSAPSTL